MKNNLKIASTICAGLFCVTMLTQCGEEGKKAGQDVADTAKEMADDAAKKGKELVDETAKKGGEMADEAGKKAEELTGMDSKEGSLSFEKGTWANSVMEGLQSGNTTVFTLDQIPYEGDELSAEGKAQLDNLASILKANPDWSIEVQGHTASPSKKLANGFARAKWVQLKMNTRGITGKQISAKGYGDEKLLKGIEATDDKNKRITIQLTKAAANA